MGPLLAGYGAALVVFLGVDAIYLGTIGGKMFKSTLGDVVAPNISFTPAVLFYLLYPIGVMIFAAVPNAGTDRWTMPLIYGALFGAFTYGTYDLTNWATIRNWAPHLVIVDIIWGAFLSGLSATAAFYAIRAVAR